MGQADGYLKIPMYGFTQSLNISVSAGVIISQLIEKIKNSTVNWQLTDSEKEVLRAEWLQCSVK
jgi:tRNA (guanosine-2'-O-)-methyltransferase